MIRGTSEDFEPYNVWPFRFLGGEVTCVLKSRDDGLPQQTKLYLDCVYGAGRAPAYSGMFHLGLQEECENPFREACVAFNIGPDKAEIQYHAGLKRDYGEEYSFTFEFTENDVFPNLEPREKPDQPLQESLQEEMEAVLLDE